MSSDNPRPKLSDYGLHPQLYFDNYPEYLRLYTQYRKDFYAWARRNDLQDEDCGCSGN